MGTVALAMQSIDQLADQLNPSPDAVQGRSLQPGGLAEMHAETGEVIGIVTIVATGPGAVFHGRTLDDGFAVVTGLCITNVHAAQSQRAWEDDGDIVVGGVTPLAAIPSGQMLAVPRT